MRLSRKQCKDAIVALRLRLSAAVERRETVEERVEALVHRLQEEPVERELTPREWVDEVRALVERTHARPPRGVFWTGSRAMGVHTSRASDWDFLVVLDGYATPLVDNVESHVTARGDRVDLSLHDTARFEAQCAAATLWALPYVYARCSWWYCDDALRARLEALAPRLPLPRVKAAALENVKTNLGTASTLWAQGSIRKCKKRVVYVARFLHYAVQVTESGTVGSYADAGVNALRRQWLGTNYGSFSHFRAAYEPAIEALRVRLRASAASYQAWEEAHATLSGPALVVAFVRHHGGALSALERLLCVSCAEVEGGPDPLVRVCNTLESPALSRVAAWCNTLLLHAHSLRPVAVGQPSMLHMLRPSLVAGAVNVEAAERPHTAHGADLSAPVRVERFVTGRRVLAWWHDSQWRFDPRASPPAVDLSGIPASWVLELRVVASDGHLVRRPPDQGRVLLVAAFDRDRAWVPVDAAVLDAQSCVARPALVPFALSPVPSFWALWDAAAREGPAESRGLVVSYRSTWLRVLVENPCVSTLRQLHDAAFESHIGQGNRKGSVTLAQGERATRSGLPHADDVALRRALCFLPTLIDVPLHTAYAFALPPALDTPPNRAALELVRTALDQLQRDVDATYGPLAALPMTTFSAAVNQTLGQRRRDAGGGVATFVYLLKRQRFETFRALLDGWDYRAKLHSALGEHLTHWWRSTVIAE